MSSHPIEAEDPQQFAAVVGYNAALAPEIADQLRDDVRREAHPPPPLPQPISDRIDGRGIIVAAAAVPMADEHGQPQVARRPVCWHNPSMSKEPKEPGAKRRSVFVEELSRQAEPLEELNAGLEGTVDELQAALTGLVEACESGATSRYIEALGRARRLLDELNAMPHQRPADEADQPERSDPGHKQPPRG